jgi:hypothetical protein
MSRSLVLAFPASEAQAAASRFAELRSHSVAGGESRTESPGNTERFSAGLDVSIGPLAPTETQLAIFWIAVTGMSKVKTEPLPGWLVTVISPPCASTMERLIASPIPVPGAPPPCCRPR